MRSAGIAVVSPVDLEHSNPQQVGDDWWVVYPFADGRPYEASNTGDLVAAGDLLGQLHSTPLDASVLERLRSYEWPQSTRNDLDRELAALATVTSKYLDNQATAALSEITRLANRWWETSLPILRDADNSEPLPRAGVSSDYKASNLVFTNESATLIDPDNGGFEPRLFDLAKAAVLFHTECPTAPARLFTASEWQTFVTAYCARVELTDQERELWPAALDHMLWEEGTWVLEDSDPAEWLDPQQGAYLRDLATATPQRYPLPGPTTQTNHAQIRQR